MGFHQVPDVAADLHVAHEASDEVFVGGKRCGSAEACVFRRHRQRLLSRQGFQSSGRAREGRRAQVRVDARVRQRAGRGAWLGRSGPVFCRNHHVGAAAGGEAARELAPGRRGPGAVLAAVEERAQVVG